MITPIVTRQPTAEELRRKQQAGSIPVFQTPQVQPQMQAQSDPGVFDRFRTMLSDPGVRTALMQTGISLLQPTYQGTVPHIASAVGEGMAAAGRRETRLATEQKEQEALDREIEKQRIELGLKAADSASLGARRQAMTAADRARLGIESGKAASTAAVNQAQIANYASMIQNRQDALALKGELGNQRNAILQGKNALSEERLRLTQQKITAESAARLKQIDAQLKNSDIALAKIASREAEVDKKIQAKLVENSMKAGSEAMIFDPDTDLDAFAKSQGQLYKNLTREFGFGGGTGQQQPPPDAIVDANGKILVPKDGQWVPWP